MKIYKNDEKETAWLNAGYIAEQGKGKGKRVTKRLDLDYESTKVILDEDWTDSLTKGQPNGEKYRTVDVPLILGEMASTIEVPGVYDGTGRAIIEPYTRSTGKKTYFIDWDAMEKQV